MKLTLELANWFDGKTIIDNNGVEFQFHVSPIINENGELLRTQLTVNSYINDIWNQETASAHNVGDTIDPEVTSWAIPYSNPSANGQTEVA